MVSLLILGFYDLTAKDIPMNRYAIVLAGGVGERLWPLSRRNNPKQFLSVDDHTSLLEQSIERLNSIIPEDNIWAVTAQEHIGRFNSLESKLGKIIIEPSGRNTGPAILNALLELEKKDPNAVVIFVSADPYIPEQDYESFRVSVEKALDFASDYDAIALLGVKPTYPATGYGYIEFDQDLLCSSLCKVNRFHEKPSEKIAASYIQMPHMLWNIGMFAAKVSFFIREFKQVAQDLYQEVIDWQQGLKSYEDITSISIDFALIERSDHIWVLPVSFSWCDVGDVDIFLSIKNKLTHNLNSVIQVKSENNLVNAKKLVALVGVQDLCVVETDDAILITKRSHAQDVRAVVTHLKKTNQISYL